MSNPSYFIWNHIERKLRELSIWLVLFGIICVFFFYSSSHLCRLTEHLILWMSLLREKIALMLDVMLSPESRHATRRRKWILRVWCCNFFLAISLAAIVSKVFEKLLQDWNVIIITRLKCSVANNSCTVAEISVRKISVTFRLDCEGWRFER